MKPTVTLEIPAAMEASVRRLLAFQEEMTELALTAPDGAVLDVCEEAVIDKGRAINAGILAEAVARRVEAAEKKGPRSAVATAAKRKKTAARRRGNS